MELRRTPYYGCHVAAGAKLVPFAGFEMPVQYAGVTKEHLAVRASVGLFDVSHMGEVRVTGPKAEEALSRLLTNAVRKIEIGEAQYNAMCNHQGGVVDDVFVYRLGPAEFIVCVNAANRDKDFAWMVANNPFPAEASFVDEGDLWGQLAIQGPNGVKVAQSLTAEAIEGLAGRRFVVGTFAGVPGCIIARTGYTGEDGFEVFIPVADLDAAVAVWDKVLAAGAPYGIEPIGLGARDTLRLEVRNMLYGHELSDELSPLQAGLGWIVKLPKPDGFIGRDAITIRKDRDEHVLVGFVMDDKRIPRDGMKVVSEGQEIGWVTSGTMGPSVGKGVGMAYVLKAFADPGTALTIDVRGKEAPATVWKGRFFVRDSAS
jgi:aminomethyltransferase